MTVPGVRPLQRGVGRHAPTGGSPLFRCPKRVIRDYGAAPRLVWILGSHALESVHEVAVEPEKQKTRVNSSSESELILFFAVDDGVAGLAIEIFLQDHPGLDLFIGIPRDVHGLLERWIQNTAIKRDLV